MRILVRKIFDLFIEGYKLNDIRRYLKEKGIKSPTGTDEWNIPSVKRILQRETYYGDDHIEPLISRGIFDRAREGLSEKKISREDEEPDDFPMAVCDVCGKKLIYKRSRGIYICDRHTGEFPKEKKLDHTPKISAQELMGIVARQYNEQLANMKCFQDKPIWITDLSIEERGADKIELGEILLGLDPGTEDYLARVESVSEKYEGLWFDWVQALKNLVDNYSHTVLRQNLPDIWRPMYRFDSRAIERSVSSIRLKEDGSVEIRFRAEEAFCR